MTTNARKRLRNRPKPPPQPDGPLQLALNQLADAIHNLTAPQPAMHNNHITWIDSRYQQLRDAIISQTGTHRSQPSSTLPLWIDALTLSLEIQDGVTAWKIHQPEDLQQITQHSWRPQDSKHLENIAATINGWAKDVDDLFAPAPIYLRGHACPHCRQDRACRINDEGERTWTPALVVSADGAVCAACHDKFHPPFLGALLGFHVEGLPA